MPLLWKFGKDCRQTRAAAADFALADHKLHPYDQPQVRARMF